MESQISKSTKNRSIATINKSNKNRNVTAINNSIIGIIYESPYKNKRSD